MWVTCIFAFIFPIGLVALLVVHRLKHHGYALPYNAREGYNNVSLLIEQEHHDRLYGGNDSRVCLVDESNNDIGFDDDKVIYLDYDLVIYRATPGGIASALSAAHTFKTSSKGNSTSSSSGMVLIIEPTGHIGGMATEGGIGLRDGHDYIRTQYFQRHSTQYTWGRLNAAHYGLHDESVLIWQPDHYVGEQSFWTMLNQSGVHVMVNTNFVEGPTGVRMYTCTPSSVRAVQLEDPYPHDNDASVHIQDAQTKTATWVRAPYWIDASYEGELMQATRKIEWTFGREPASQYKEPWGGVTNYSAAAFPLPISPFGPDGHLIKLVQRLGSDPNLVQGQPDDNLMAYSFRVCLTQDVHRSLPVPRPPKYDPADWILAQRLVRAELACNMSLSQPWLYLDYMGYERLVSRENKDQTELRDASTRGEGVTEPIGMKFDACCGTSPVGIDVVGLAVGYANATRQERAALANNIRSYVHGLLYFWRNDASIPEAVRRQHESYGLCADAWTDNGHMPRQVYVREAARMVGDRVFTQRDRSRWQCRADSIGVGTWGVDIHDMQRIGVYDRRKRRWVVVNEGLSGDNHQDGVFPFDLPYWLILPKRRELANLAVIYCPSVSHVAFGAIRTEPSAWQLGMAAGTASAIAILSPDVWSLHDVPIVSLREYLLEQGSILHWPVNSTCANEGTAQ